MVVGIVTNKTGSDVTVSGTHYTIRDCDAIEPGDTVEVVGKHVTSVCTGYWHAMKGTVVSALRARHCTPQQFEHAVGFEVARSHGDAVVRSVFAEYFAGKCVRWHVARVTQEWDGEHAQILFTGCADRFDVWSASHNKKRVAITNGSVIEIRFEFWMSEQLDAHQCVLIADASAQPSSMHHHGHTTKAVDLELVQTAELRRPETSKDLEPKCNNATRVRDTRNNEWWYSAPLNSTERHYFDSETQHLINAAWNRGDASTRSSSKHHRILFDTPEEQSIDGIPICHHDECNFQVDESRPLDAALRVHYAVPNATATA